MLNVLKIKKPWEKSPGLLQDRRQNHRRKTVALAKEVAASLKPGVLKNQRVFCVAAVMWVPYVSAAVIDRGLASVANNAVVLKCVYKNFRTMLFLLTVLFCKTRILNVKNFMSTIF
jgi:hypothetical protein